MTMVALRDTPTLCDDQAANEHRKERFETLFVLTQWTKVLPPLFLASSMNSQALWN